MIKEQLIELGFTENEVLIYLATLEIGEATIGRIAQKSGVKRTTAYFSIESLKKKGLLSELKKNKRTFFYAEDPRILQEKMEERKKAIDNIIPQLLSITNLMDKKPKITFHEGIDGIKDVYRDGLKYPNQEMLAWVSQDAFYVLDDEFVNYYIPKRVSKRIWVRAICPDTPEMKDYKSREVAELRKTKLISSEKYPIEVEIDLYGKNKISILAFKEGISLIIESTKIYNTLKSIFEMQWEMLL